MSVPPGFRILIDREVGQYPTSVLGSAIGNLIDCGLTDLEVLTVVEELCKMIRGAVKDPEMRPNLDKQIDILRRAAEGEG